MGITFVLHCRVSRSTCVLICRFSGRNVIRFWGSDPNHTSIKIKLTPPMDSYTSYHTSSTDPQHYLKYSRLLLTDVFSGRCGRLE